MFTYCKNKEEEIKEYVEKLNISELLANVLKNRNVSIEKSKIILDEWNKGIKDPRELLNSEAAANKITEYCKNKNALIAIYGDYDADGVTSIYTMKGALNLVCKCSIETHTPERTEGYGLSNNYVDYLIDYKSKTNKDILVITVDNGINQIEQINKLIENDIEVVVTDHHKPNGEIPNCICVNPWIEEDDSNRYLSGCAVAFKVAQIVLWNFDKGAEMMDFTPYAAISTITDVMPLSLENMCLVQYGLAIINSDECPSGIKYYKEYSDYKMITSQIIAWNLGPTINACGRLGDAKLAYKMFDTSLLESPDEIEDIVIKMIYYNDQRAKKTKKALNYIKTLDFENDKACVVYLEGVENGIAGNIAGKIKDLYNKPAIVLTGKDSLTGSARSIENININDIIKEEINKGIITQGGGHEVAAGLSMNKDNIEQLKNDLNELIENVETDSEVEKDIIIDYIIETKNINKKTYNELNRIPYGNGFEQPYLLMNIDIKNTKNSKNNADNICFNTTKNKQFWGWGFNDKYNELGKPSKLSLIGNVDVDFRNKSICTFSIKDIGDTNELN